MGLYYRRVDARGELQDNYPIGLGREYHVRRRWWCDNMSCYRRGRKLWNRVCLYTIREFVIEVAYASDN